MTQLLLDSEFSPRWLRELHLEEYKARAVSHRVIETGLAKMNSQILDEYLVKSMKLSSELALHLSG